MTQCTEENLALFSTEKFTYINQIFGDETVREAIKETYAKRDWKFLVEPASEEFDDDSDHHFLEKKGKYSTIRKIFAPIWVKGPINEFVSNNIVTVGDAAGQAKPTTAGGIFSCGMGVVFAGKAISKFLKSGNKLDLQEYKKNWDEKFGKEFEQQLLARKILEKLDNKTIDKLFDLITPNVIKDISEKDDFDFHTGSLIKLLGLKGSIKAAQTLLGGKIKDLLPH